MQSIFGTDGIRGVFNKELSLPLAEKVGYALGEILINEEPVLIGRDTRVSGYSLLESLNDGLNLANKKTIDIGICPTPAIPFLIKKYNFSSGIMISASHNPPEYNGIKIFNSLGKKLNDIEEKRIEKRINEIEKKNFSFQKQRIIRKENLLDFYITSLIESMKGTNLSGLKIILDTCHGSATSCAEQVFKELGAEIYVINNEPDGLKINLECGSTFLNPLKQAIQDFNADLGFSFDGDADRVIGMDSSYNILDGDHILFLWGRELMKEKNLSNNMIISTTMANLGFENAWKSIGGLFIRTAVGDKFIHDEIFKKSADLGGEQSGHILSKINNFSGDGILTAIQIAKYCKKKNLTLNEWIKSSFIGYPQKLTNIKIISTKKYLIPSIEGIINEVISSKLAQISEPCRIFVRPSGTEPILRVLVEAENYILVDKCSKEITLEIENILKKFKLTN
tara:strand:- start:6403 stop:7758 length:1356 start_codon:yes stop_codon:yes gene_type:complete